MHNAFTQSQSNLCKNNKIERIIKNKTNGDYEL
nr:MAG TPA: hypothetical protein [Caudoviricetes sp.]